MPKQRFWEGRGVVEASLGLDSVEAGGFDYDAALTQRRSRLAVIYDALPLPGSAGFWPAVAEADVPLEVLVRCLRASVSRGDVCTRNRLLALIVQRTQTTNEQWVWRVLKAAGLAPGECSMLAADLYADLCECMLRALLDTRRLFWEEKFLHSLYFERKHVFRALMTREGRWHDPTVTRSERVPRAALISLDRVASPGSGEAIALEIEDWRAEMLLRAIDRYDLLQRVLYLPVGLRSVLLLVFWEERSERETARILGITDRTVRNRLKQAFNALRVALVEEGRQIAYD